MQWKDYEGNGMGNRMIRENLEHVKANIKRACEGSGRKEEDVTLIAVSKTKPLPMLMDAYECGCRDFGENKVQELVDKWEQMPKDIRWHMIGHLQRNKVKYIAACGRNQQRGREKRRYRICSDRNQCSAGRIQIRNNMRRGVPPGRRSVQIA